MQNPSRFIFLFEKYQQNKCTEAELLELFQLLENPRTESLLNEQMLDLWESIRYDHQENTVDWDRIYTRAKTAERIYPIRRKILKPVFYYAASFIAFVCVLSFLVFYVKSKPATGKNNVANFAAPGLNYVKKTVPFNQTMEFRLDDGSRIVLNSGSKFYYPERFQGKTREVYLDGEAYFQVVHKTDQPFIVHANHTRTQVLGTSFNVNAYHEAKNTEVTVLTGKVAVKDPNSNNNMLLDPNQRITINNLEGSVSKTTVQYPEDVIAWREGTLVFEDASLAEVAMQLSLKYGIKTSLENDSLTNCRVSAVFHQRSLSSILKIITRLTHTEYKEQKKSIIIYGKGC